MAFNPAVIKKKMKEHGKEELMPKEKYEMSEESESYAKPLKVGKKAAEHAMDSMDPEGEHKMGKHKKGMMPEAKIEIELMLEGAKKKKGK